MAKIDLKKELKHLYQPSAKEVVQVDVPTMNYLMVDGEGDPNTSQTYADAVAALFMVSYAVKFMVKKGGRRQLTMGSCRWKVYGGLTICRALQPLTSPTGNGQ